MANSKETIIAAIMDYMNKHCPNGTPYSKLYIGIAKDAKDRLFNGHGVDKDKDPWIYDTASSAAIAREIEKHFLDKGFDGGPGGGDDDTKMVYCFLQSSHTRR